MPICLRCKKQFWLFFREYKKGLCKKCYLNHLENEKLKLVTNSKIISTNKIFDDFIVLDFETTGLDNIKDEIIEIAAIKYRNGRYIDQFYTLVDPEMHIPYNITKLTGINDMNVRNKPTIDKCIEGLVDFIGELPIVAHNATFDVNFLLANSYYSNKPIQSKYKIDTVKLSREIFKELPNHKLITIKKYLNLDIDSHRAFNDCKVCAEIYFKYCVFKKQQLFEEEKHKEEMFYKCIINPQKCLDVVNDILYKNNKSADYIRTSYTGNYFDIKLFLNFLRLKLNGKKHYIILDFPKEEFINNYQDEQIENTSKSETGKSRVYISSENDLYKFDKLILKQYDITIEKLNSFRKYSSNAEDYIREYLCEE